MPPQEFLPHPILSNFVEKFWFVERQFTPPNNIFDILPDSKIELIFSLGAPCYLKVDKQEQLLAPCYIVGFLEQNVLIHATGLVKLVCARFYPWGFYTLLSHLLEQPVLGLCVAGPAFDALSKAIDVKLGESKESAIAELQHFLIDRILEITLKDADFVQAAQQIFAQKGDLTVADLAQATHISPRTLSRKFNAILGIAPKTLARATRFEYVRDTLWKDPDTDLSQVALAAGYADQAHMQREFRQFSNRTPRQFASEMRQLQNLPKNLTDRNLQEK